MMRRVLSPATAWPAAFLLLGLHQAVSAQAHNIEARPTYFPDTAAIKLRISGDAVVGYASGSDFNPAARPTNPTISLVSGGVVTGCLYVYNNSTFNMKGGSIGGVVVEQGDTGKTLNGLIARGGSRINLSGGSIEEVSIFDSSRVTMRGGSIRHDLAALDASAVTISGGSIKRDLDAFNHSTLTIRGGSIAGDVYARDASALRIRGGSVGGELAVSGSARLDLFGTGLKATATDSHAIGSEEHYTLSGKLADGTDITGKSLSIRRDKGARFLLHNALSHPASRL